jgi:glycosyltransferase involved in cell wall biosynthesis
VPLGNSVSSASHAPFHQLGLPDKYVLFVGTRDRYKNFPFFLKVVAGLLRKWQLRLVCAGGGSFTESEKVLIKNYGLEGLVQQRMFADEDLPVIYKNARVFVFPSEYEGFGMPILEAMKCHCPVVLSENGVFREIAREAALYFELGNEQSLQNAIENVLENEDLRTTLLKRGEEREKEFSWQKTAKGYYHSIQKAMQRKVLISSY